MADEAVLVEQPPSGVDVFGRGAVAHSRDMDLDDGNLKMTTDFRRVYARR